MATHNTFARMERAQEHFMRQTDIDTTGDEIFDEQVASAWKNLRLKENNFGDVYDATELEKDKQYLERTKTRFEDKEGETARGLHTAIMEGVSQYDWLGPDANVVYTTEYDDIANGTDFVVCFEQEEGPSLKIAVDVTTSESLMVLKQKLERVMQRLKLNGWLPEIKYFEYAEAASDQEPRGKVELPRVILGTDRHNTKELIDSFSNALSQKGVKGREARRQLGEQDLQHELISEMIAQLSLQLEASVEKFKDFPAEECPDTVNGLLDWGDDWHELEEGGVLTDNLVEELKEELTHIEEDATGVFTSHLKSAKHIAEALLYLHALQKEKSAGQQPSARGSNLTSRQLSRPADVLS